MRLGGVEGRSYELGDDAGNAVDVGNVDAGFGEVVLMPSP